MKLQCPYLSQFSEIKHAFFESDPEVLNSRRKKVMEEMTGQSIPLVTLKQVHGNKVVHITESSKNNQKADGLVTKVKGIALGILTADCGPVLFYDPHAKVIGACHAGWRGAKAGILQETIKSMVEIGAQKSCIYASLGPTIQQSDYEVGPEFPDLINEPYETYFYSAEKKGHHYFNLPFYICQQLLREGLAYMHDIKCNTFSGNFSSRRRFLSEEKNEMSSDNLSAIAII